MAARYTPTTDTGRGVATLLTEALESVSLDALPPLLRAARPLLMQYIEGEIDKAVAGADAHPEETRAALAPLIERVAVAFGYTVTLDEGRAA